MNSIHASRASERANEHMHTRLKPPSHAAVCVSVLERAAGFGQCSLPLHSVCAACSFCAQALHAFELQFEILGANQTKVASFIAISLFLRSRKPNFGYLQVLKFKIFYIGSLYHCCPLRIAFTIDQHPTSRQDAAQMSKSYVLFKQCPMYVL